MSHDYPDEFVVFPSGSNVTTKLRIRHDGSRDPSCPSVSGRQHRPAEPVHDTLRCMEAENCSSNASGPGHEREFNMVSVPNVTGGSPGALVNEPGKLVGFGTRVGPECSAPVAAMLNVTSALRKGLHEYRVANGYELAPMEGPVPVAGSEKLHNQHVNISQKPLLPIAGPKNCGPGCCSTPSMRHSLNTKKGPLQK